MLSIVKAETSHLHTNVIDDALEVGSIYSADHLGDIMAVASDTGSKHGKREIRRADKLVVIQSTLNPIRKDCFVLIAETTIRMLIGSCRA